MTDAAAAIAAETADIESVTRHIRAVCDRLIAREVERGAAQYVRERDLPSLIRNWDMLSDGAILDTLRRKIQVESAHIIAGFWHADSHRLIALKQALAGEQARGSR
jgi:hypothetical protein